MKTKENCLKYFNDIKTMVNKRNKPTCNACKSKFQFSCM